MDSGSRPISASLTAMSSSTPSSIRSPSVVSAAIRPLSIPVLGCRCSVSSGVELELRFPDDVVDGFGGDADPEELEKVVLPAKTAGPAGGGGETRTTAARAAAAADRSALRSPVLVGVIENVPVAPGAGPIVDQEDRGAARRPWSR